MALYSAGVATTALGVVGACKSYYFLSEMFVTDETG
jgi:hypothetical protein